MIHGGAAKVIKNPSQGVAYHTLLSEILEMITLITTSYYACAAITQHVLAHVHIPKSRLLHIRQSNEPTSLVRGELHIIILVVIIISGYPGTSLIPSSFLVF